MLSVWQSSGGEHYMVAESEADAADAFHDWCGDDEPDWKALPDDRLLVIQFDEDTKACGCETAHLARMHQMAASKDARRLEGFLANGHRVNCAVGSDTKTCAEWAASNGRGFLCSTEW